MMFITMLGRECQRENLSSRDNERFPARRENRSREVFVVKGLRGLELPLTAVLPR